MARSVRHADTALNLVGQVLKEGYEFDFAQVVRILEGASPNCIPLGEGSDPKQEAFIISSRVTFGVSASDIQRVWHTKRYHVEINFLGLAGVNKPLPQPYIELAIERLRVKDRGLQDFWDIFNHRLVSHWYRIQKKYIPGTSTLSPLHTPIGKSLLDLTGLFTPDLINRLQVSPRTLLAYAALLWQRPRSAIGLVRLLQSYFKIPVHVEQFHGAWQEGEIAYQTQIAFKGRYSVLGRDTILGRKAWDQADGIEIVIGPVRWSVFLDLLPFARGNKILQELIHLYCGKWLKVHTRLLVNEVYTLPLGQGTRLGYTTWLTQRHSSDQVRRVQIGLQINM